MSESRDNVVPFPSAQGPAPFNATDDDVLRLLGGTLRTLQRCVKDARSAGITPAWRTYRRQRRWNMADLWRWLQELEQWRGLRNERRRRERKSRS